jgi:hypothetical protein
LSDGALLVVTAALDADRVGTRFSDRIPPDEEVPIAWERLGTSDDPVLQAARRWLANESACRRQTTARAADGA